MSRIFLCSDPHFHHESMIKHRGFNTVDEYHESYVKRWNSVVSKRDVVYILGDITMEKDKYEILGELTGIKHVILGNHDVRKRSHLESLMKYCNKVLTSKKLDYGEHKLILTHIPIHPIEFDYMIDFNIHGHLHDKEINDERYINICPEKIGYQPILLEELMSNKLK